jgi:hypothetical protein
MNNRLLTILLCIGAAIAVGSATARPLKSAQEAPVTPAGPSRSCIPLTGIDHTRVRNDRTIDFYMLGHKVYRNVLPQPCPELGFEERFGYETSLSQLCSTDIITVLHDSPPVRGASCGLGQFQPVTGAPRS